MATAAVTPQQLRAMRALVASMHRPPPPYPAPDCSAQASTAPKKARPEQLHEGAAYAAAFVEIATKAGLAAEVGNPPPATGPPWRAPHHTICLLRYAEAKDAENLEDVVKTMMLSGGGDGGKRVYVKPQIIVAGGEPQLFWLTIVRVVLRSRSTQNAPPTTASNATSTRRRQVENQR